MRARRIRLPTPGVVIGALALVVALSGSAVGASLITSKQIKDGTNRIADLSPSARAALKGNPGGAGAQGQAGAAGLPGSRGVGGVQGPDGDLGPIGPTGDNGARGSTGTSKVIEATRDGVQAFGTTPVTIATLTLPAGSAWMVQARTLIGSGQSNVDNLISCILRFRTPNGSADYAVDDVSAYMGFNQPGDVARAPFPFIGVLGPTDAGSTLSVRCQSSDTPNPASTITARMTKIWALEANSASSEAVTG